MDILGRLFGSGLKVKLIKLFLFNGEQVFLVKDISKKFNTNSLKIKKDISDLQKSGFVKKRIFKSGNGYILNRNFVHLVPLQNFFINIGPLETTEIIKKIGKIGNIKLIITSGVFIHDSESRADLLIVGDGIKKNKLENTIKSIESDIGKELKYVHFSLDEFKYRLSMYDKLTRDILDYPHNKVLNKLGIL